MAQIDVLLPIKSPAPWLGSTLESLRTQTYSDWQLVASIHGDDADARKTVLAHVPDAKIVIAPGDGNLASTLNVGLWATTAPYIARIDQDDIAFPHRFQVQIDFLRMNPAVVAVGSGATLIDGDDKIIGYRSQLEGPQKVLRKLRWKSPLMHPSVMFTRETVIAIGGYTQLATNVEDYELWLRLASSGLLAGINEPLIQYRLHPQQITSFRSIPRDARQQVKQSRIDFAKSEGKSILAAKFRHLVWLTRQASRSIRRQQRT